MIVQASNWLVGLLMLCTMSVSLLWGLDLVIVACLQCRARRWHILRSGPFYLGWYFIVSALFVFGLLGFVLLRRPYETVPSWFAMPCLIFTVDIVLAWHFLGVGTSEGEGE